jgi:tetratricopeptide (TPR) repeat protein
LTNKATILEKTGKTDEAIKCYDRVIKIRPDFLYAYSSKALALGNLGKFTEALEYHDKAIKLSPDEDIAWYNKARTYSLMKNRTGMLDCLKKAIELNKEYMEKAKKDNDFKEYRNDSNFLEIVN